MSTGLLAYLTASARVFVLCLMSTGVGAHHDGVYFQGVNYLQTSTVSLNSFTSMESLRKIKANGADTIALIAFMQQDSPSAKHISHSAAVTDKQLVQAIADAQDIGLRVILKPQILVKGSWAGEVDPGSEEAWRVWFSDYQAQILKYADIAQRFEVAMLVLGTELRHASVHPLFRQLIIEVRKRYHGELSYAAHGIEGYKRFPYWGLLDSSSLTLYPPLGDDWSLAHVNQVMLASVAELQQLTAGLEKPLWVAEIGISSRKDSYRHPWQVSDPLQGEADAQTQATVLALWLKHLQQPWVHGVLIWNWFSDVEKGGVVDTGFTIQNKPAESVVSCYWKKQC